MDLNCWNCGGLLPGVLMPLSRREECPHCRAELHVCRQCEHYDPTVSDQCREDRAEQVRDKTQANFCDYFKLKPDVLPDAGGQTDVSPELAALFGLDPAADSPQPPSLDDVFDPNKSD